MWWLDSLWRWMWSWWDAVNRKTDLQILWPTCLEHAEDRDHAKAAFFFHVSNDPSWTNHYTAGELIDFVDKL